MKKIEQVKKNKGKLRCDMLHGYARTNYLKMELGNTCLYKSVLFNFLKVSCLSNLSLANAREDRKVGKILRDYRAELGQNFLGNVVDLGLQMKANNNKVLGS